MSIKTFPACLMTQLCLAVCVPVGAMANDEIRIDNAGLSTLHEATISAEEAGPLLEVPVKEGASVGPGDLLARMKDAEAKLHVEQAQIDLRTAEQLALDDTALRLAQKELELALSDLARNEKSNKQLSNSVPEARMERLRLIVARERLKVEKATQEMQLARIALDAAKNQLKIAQARLARRELRSPIRGTVVEVFCRTGEWVQMGQPVVRILEHERLRSEAYVDASALVFPAEGKPADFEADVPTYGRQVFHGTVTFVSPEANPVNGQVRIVAEIDNRDGKLRPGYLGTLVIHPAVPATTEP